MQAPSALRSTYAYRSLVFLVLAGALAGLGLPAGGAVRLLSIPEMLSWHERHGDWMMIIIPAASVTLRGAIIGAVAFVLLQELRSPTRRYLAPRWPNTGS